ncbi:MAG TPA: YbaB/EbfC family nucleoid-associated protein [Actinophytocola sp.]|uniref:YbaB/EbfC family nucleoid-associated protein n=1 Tax=Actinophytocola sp. TaxID=1872138 RepID=UPI002DB6A59F|nr:YbaB/EbfC family nucleoid-associated protein [Actinophytocola sp.]HEU5475319.1 YbaB/EbfC family nucleoid-associated protein [Actinophytocola sp.]
MQNDPEVDAMVEQLRRQEQEIDRIRRDVEAMVVKGRSRAGEVEASVRGNGRLAGVSIDPATVRQYDTHDLGVIVTEAVNAALDNLAKVVQARFAPTLASLPA